jgi:hypothetical protein
MSDRTIPLGLREVGAVADRSLRDGAQGRVGAAFDRSFYVVLDGQWICFGPPALGSGPLNALFAPAARALAIAAGQTCHVADGTLFADGFALVSRRSASVWRPAAPSWTIDTLDAGLNSFDGPRESPIARDALGLIGGANASPASAVLAAAAHRPALRLADGIRCALARDRETGTAIFAGCDELLGLGPGLTPSGDDVLGGAMVALAMLGCERQRDALWTTLRQHVPHRTTDIAGAHLAAAADGLGAAALHDALASILSGDAAALPAALARLDTVGHSSGWDGLAGALLVMRIYRETTLDRLRAA